MGQLAQIDCDAADAVVLMEVILKERLPAASCGRI
jgi:hypothetical protein